MKKELVLNPITECTSSAPRRSASPLEKQGRPAAGFYAAQCRKRPDSVGLSLPVEGWFSALECTFKAAESAHAAQSSCETKPSRRLVTVCAWCDRIRNKEGCWQPFLTHLPGVLEVELSHGICAECAEQSYDAYRAENSWANSEFSVAGVLQSNRGREIGPEPRSIYSISMMSLIS
jgi:hypothetical protein